MQLTKDQEKIVLDKLGKLIDKKICNSCDNEVQFSINTRLFELREFNEGSLVIGGNSAIIPLIVITCPKCGNTRFYNALTLGLLKQDQKSDGAKK